MWYHPKFFIRIVSFAGIILGCRPPAATVHHIPESYLPPVVVEAPLQIPMDSGSSVFTGLRNYQSVYQFYQVNRFQVTWLNDSSASLLDSMITFIQAVRYHGLLPQDYHAEEVIDLHGASGRLAMYRTDVLLTDAFLSLANDLKYGRLNAVHSTINTDSLNLVALNQALRNKAVRMSLRLQEPQYPQYQELISSLKTIIDEADSIARKALLAGYMYDTSSVQKKVQCIEVNLERWRMELPSLGSRYIWINIPSYQLQVLDRGKIALESRVIVGKPDTPTPTLSSAIECITFFPYWYVPRKITVEEFLPRIKKDSSFLSLNNFEVLDRKGKVVDPDTLAWASYNKNNFPFALRQREGEDNSLGVIKFVFDNPHAVYLHDTNAKGLFRSKKRAFSHGCIRMEKAEELANYLVPVSGKIDKLLDLKIRQTVNLADPIPIYVRYLTCEFIKGTLNFYDDIYMKDRAIVSFLYNR
jgi:L,D-transpeptidase YcbB